MIWFEALSPLGRFFFITGASSLIILIIQTALALFGAGGNDDASDVSGLHAAEDCGTDAEMGEFDLADHDGDLPGDGSLQANTLFNVRGILTFTSVGSFTALALLRISPILAVVGALAGGVAAAWAMAHMMRALSRLAQSGNLRMHRAIGLVGEVYIPIPGEKRGEGKVFVLLQERLSELSAVTEGDTIQTGTQVRVVGVYEDDRALIVEPLVKTEPHLVLK